MKAKLIFNLPEDTQDFQLATDGYKYHNALWELDQFLRNTIKYSGYSEEETKPYQIVRNMLIEFMNDDNINFIL